MSDLKAPEVLEELEGEIDLNPVYDYEKGFNDGIYKAIEIIETAMNQSK